MRQLELRHGRTSLLRGSMLAFLLGFSTGCYTYAPVAATPVKGMRVLVDLNDTGRVGLGDAVGTSARSIEGTLETDPDSALALRVHAVQYLSGGNNIWNGERVTVNRGFVRDIRERRFSRGRTYLTVGGVVGAAVVFIATRGLIGRGNAGKEPGPGGPGNES